eukprot:CAMPEP_0172500930 /NCGR_PEP_ID=MMETSP1066-20121228/144210_1 /TAXON_ID=671091 /ORGANISM="Coscinodiscus wailesii, Strain CCMP2513" /LENGTH=651 /DNA_ID=CAMNT_0013275431 /DNA_START=541 /DNA_END=2496 /DNA_ORIENTATION=+
MATESHYKSPLGGGNDNLYQSSSHANNASKPKVISPYGPTNSHRNNNTKKQQSTLAAFTAPSRNNNSPPPNSIHNNSAIIYANYKSSMRNPKPTVSIPKDFPLNLEQRHVVESVLSGHSTFFTGPAGSGKSHVLSSILRLNDDTDVTPRKRKIIVTATTGIAACNVGGVTIHSFAGIGTGEGQLSNLVAKVMGNSHAKKRWRECDVLVIDEVSMMPASFLDNLNFVAKRARDDRREFGGIQVVLCGDFFQLPPVSLKSGGFAFEAECWSRVVQCSILLKQIFRQNGDTELMEILNEARIGELSRKSIQVLRAHQHHATKTESDTNKNKDGETTANKTHGDGENIKPTLLQCKNRQVDEANIREMVKLPGETHDFKAKDRGVNATHRSHLKNCSAPEKLSLKVGSQVILLKNLDQDKGLVNGSRGVVVDFQKSTKPADLPREFKQLELPVVKFYTLDAVGSNGDDKDEVVKIIEPAEWVNKVGDEIMSSRYQIPLRLAWALSVHKSQGMTIPNLIVSLAGVFEYGQAYVALSRATKLSQLTLRGFHAQSFRAHPKVKQFYRMLNGEEEVVLVPQSARQQPGSSETKTQWLSTAAPTITKEQMKRMEENKQRALAIRRQKQQDAASSADFTTAASLLVSSARSPASVTARSYP